MTGRPGFHPHVPVQMGREGGVGQGGRRVSLLLDVDVDRDADSAVLVLFHHPARATRRPRRRRRPPPRSPVIVGGGRHGPPGRRGLESRRRVGRERAEVGDHVSRGLRADSTSTRIEKDTEDVLHSRTVPLPRGYRLPRPRHQVVVALSLGLSLLSFLLLFDFWSVHPSPDATNPTCPGFST